jgi:hypothetical protein
MEEEKKIRREVDKKASKDGVLLVYQENRLNSQHKVLSKYTAHESPSHNLADNADPAALAISRSGKRSSQASVPSIDVVECREPV